MNDTPWQFAHREMQRLLQHPRFWIGLGAAVMILTISGPFGTLEQMSFAERLVYWGLTAGLTFFCGLSFSIFIGLSLYDFGMSAWPSRIMGGFVAGFPVAVIVWCINHFAFGLDMGGWEIFFRISLHCMIISVAVMLVYYLLNNREEVSSASSPFLDRLPKHLGKNLLHLTAQDHYVKAVTDRGSELILMRFADALREVSEMEGIQIHRAHWVSHGAVKKPVKKDGKLFIETLEGEQFPVSRSHMKAVKEALNIK